MRDGMLKDKDLKEIQALIDLGKERGYVTYDEMNTALPTHLISSDQIDDVMIMFSNMDIEVVNQVRKRDSTRGMGVTEAKPELLPTGRSTDPVRMYLRKMGRVSLLSREGEIEIARRIEDGEMDARRLILTSSVAVHGIKEIYEEEAERLDKAARNGKRPRGSESARLEYLRHASRSRSCSTGATTRCATAASGPSPTAARPS